MMFSTRKTIFTLLVSVAISSCSKEIDNVEPQPGNADISLFEIGDGVYDAAGHGTDVTVDYATREASRFPVLDMPKLVTLPGAVRYLDNLNENEIISNYSENALDYSKKISKMQDVTNGFSLFKKNISSSFNNSTTTGETFNGKYIYSCYDQTLIKKQIIIDVANINTLTNYLTTFFWEDSKNLTPSALVTKYGTHVMMNIIVGGRLQIRYQSESRSNTRTEASKAGVKWAMGNMNGITNTEEVDMSLRTANYNQSMYVKSIGGSANVSFSGGISNPPVIDINPWKNSVGPENSVLIDFGSPNSLVPIYEFITDPAKKAEVKAYVNKYLKDNEVVLDYYFAGWYGNDEGYHWDANKSGQVQEREYNPKNGTASSTSFRAPKTGVYKVNASCYGYKEGGSGSGSATIQIRVYNSSGNHVRTLVSQSCGAGSGWTRAAYNGNITLVEGDLIRVHMNGGSVGAINRMVRYRMEHMDVEYISQ